MLGADLVPRRAAFELVQGLGRIDGALRHLTGRVIEAPEVAAAIAFLASSEASAITGTTLLADGGLAARLAV